jgi:hypothetical protein
VHLLIDNKEKLDFSLIDDVCFGKFLSSNNIPLINSYRFDLTYNTNEIDEGFFHYRLKTNNRINDINNMILIHKKKLKWKK